MAIRVSTEGITGSIAAESLSGILPFAM